MDDELLEKYCWVVNGFRRRRVLMEITDNVLSSQVSRKAKVDSRSVYKYLRPLLNEGLITVRQARNTKMYSLTELGKKVRERVEEYERDVSN